MMMLERAIDDYHQLLDDETARATQAQLTEMQRAQNLFFGDRPLCSVLRPRLMTAAHYALLQQGVGTVVAALQKLGDALLATPALRADLALTPQEEALIAIDPGYKTHSAHSRMDTFLTVDGNSLRFVEFNGESPAAIAYEDELAALFLDLPAMRQFAQQYDVRALPARRRLLDTLLDAWRTAGHSRTPTIAILDWKGLPTHSEFLLFRSYFAEQGLDAIICTPDALVYRDGRLYATSYESLTPRTGDFPIDIVYKRVLTSELLVHYGGGALDHPLIHAYAAGAIVLVNSFRAKLLHKKAVFALLTHEEFAGHFTAEEQAAIAAHVPWTRVVRAGQTTYQDGQIDLLDFARRNRDRLVLKPNDEYGGKGVLIGWETSAAAWDAALAAAVSTPSIVQERVEIAYEMFPAVVDGKLQITRRLVDTDPFTFGSQVQGALCRLSTVTLLNVTAGGGSTAPVFIIGAKDTVTG